MSKRTGLLIVFGVVVCAVNIAYFAIKTSRDTSTSQNQPLQEETMTKPSSPVDNTDNLPSVSLQIGGQSYIVRLEDNATAHAFLERLPLEIEMNELNSNEKYHYFAEAMPSNPARVGRVQAGDIMLYGDDCLVLFYETFETSYQYTRIGKIVNPDGLKGVVGSGNIPVHFASNS